MYPNRFRAKPTLDATRPLPGASGQSVSQSAMQTQREKILQNVLNGSAVFSVIALAATIPPRLSEGQYVLIAIFITAFLGLLVVTFNRKIAYRFRAVFFLALMAVLGFATLFSDGLYGNGRLFLIALPVVTAILLGPRPGYIALGVNILGVALAGALMVTGVLAPPVFLEGNVNASLSFWILATAVTTLVSSVTAISLVVMFRGYEDSLSGEQRLRQELGAERSSLEVRVQERTRDLERRLVQIRTAADISLALSAELDPDIVLQQVVDLVQNRFDLYYVGVFLVDENRHSAVLRAGSGEAGQRMLAQGHNLPLDGQSMVAWAVNLRQPRIALDVGKEAVRFNNPVLPLTRSELALPILTQGASGEPAVALGAMTVQSVNSSAFDQDDIIVLRTIAASLATALQNANLFKQLGRSLEEIRTLNRQYLQQAWNTENQPAVQSVAQIAGLEADPTAPEPLSLPITLRDQVIGSLQVSLSTQGQPGAETPSLAAEDLEFLEIIAAQTALAVENVRLLEETQRRAAYDRLLTDITRTARSAPDLETILRSTLHELSLALGASEAVIQLEVEPAEGEER